MIIVMIIVVISVAIDIVIIVAVFTILILFPLGTPVVNRYKVINLTKKMYLEVFF